jgi:tetratricopeptide (TPR) repeat protein
MLVLNTAPFFIARGTGSTDYGAHLGGALFGGATGFFLFREWDLKKFQARWGGLGKGLAYGGGAIYFLAVVFAVAGFEGSRQWYADNQLTEKIQLYTAYIQRDPENVKAFDGRGFCFYQEKTRDGYQKAIQDFTSALVFSNDDFDALFLRGCAHRHLGELPQSIDDMNRCALLKPDNSYVYNNRGLAYAEWKKYKQALDDYAEALRIKPQAAYVLVNEGDVYFQLHRYTKAMADLNQAIDLSQIFGKAFTDRGSIYLLQGNLKMALSDFDMALKLNNRDVAAYQGRAVVYQKMDLPEMAKDDVKNAKLYQNTGLND